MDSDANTPEPEEAVEAALVAFVAERATLPVEGAVSPATEGTVKNLTADSFISVAVDQNSQDLDRRGESVPHTYEASVTVRVASCDDASGHLFRDECRRVRAALNALTGDGCAAITTATASAFDCDGFILSSTKTSFDGGESPVMSKTYNATIKGRVDTSTTQTAQTAE